MHFYRTCLSCTLIALTAACSTTPSSSASSNTLKPAYQITVPDIKRPAQETSAWWYTHGAAEAAQRQASAGNAKNVIIFLGDGMSLPTVAAARILEGQRKGQPGEENLLSWERFPSTAFSKTYNVDAQTPDSAGTMSAIATGSKTRMGIISIGMEPKRGDCALGKQHALLSLWELAQSSNLATGVVTTTRVTHATPATTFAHSSDRNWENDTDLPEQAKAAGCVDIARQMIETPFGRGPDVLMGGGRGNFMLATQEDPEYSDKVGQRLDERDLIAEWKSRHPQGHYVWNKSQFDQAPINQPVFALFEPDHMQYEHDRAKDKAGEPSLAEMTRSAIQRLQTMSRNNKQSGFVLLVEGGRIDHAHHAGNAYRALTDTVALSDAVRVADELTSDQDTLIIVTADHAHTLNFVGYPARGNAILDKVKGGSGEDGDPDTYALDATGLPFTTLSYANGPGYVGATSQQKEGSKKFPHFAGEYEHSKQGRPDLSQVDTQDPDYMQEALVPLKSETHGGDDVGIWARGPGSHAVHGTLEQNSIFHIAVQSAPVLRNALCSKTHCQNGIPSELPDRRQFIPTQSPSR